MVKQEYFEVEQFMDRYEKGVKYNMGETCCFSLSIEQVLELISEKDKRFDLNKYRQALSDQLLSTRLTYGNIQGSNKLKAAIARLYNDGEKSDRLVDQDNIIITNGAIGANFLTLYSLVDKDDHVIVVDPSYQQLSSVPSIFTANKENVDLLNLKFEDEFQPDLTKLKQMIKRGKTKLLVINNPNNPTGAVWDNEVLESIVKICQEHNIYLLCDEVYRPLFHSTDNPPSSITNFGYDKCISTSSMSKAFSMAGLRLGWIVSHDKDFIQSALSKRDFITISISSIDDQLASFALQYYEVILEKNYIFCRANLKLLDDFIRDSNGLIQWVRPQGGSTAFVKINVPNINTYEMCSELAEKYGCLIVPGEVFGKDKAGYLRIGFGNSKADLVGGLGILKKYLFEKGLWL